MAACAVRGFAKNACKAARCQVLFVRHSTTTGSLLPAGELWGGGGGAVPASVGSATLDWKKLGFEYTPTNGHMLYSWKNGEWSRGQFVRDPYISVHILANVFHYGQAIFEGFKAFHTQDGSVKTFADEMSHKRMNYGCGRFRMPPVPLNMWRQAVDQAVRENIGYMPPYGSRGSMYIRPFMFGSGPRLGLGPSQEYTFVVFVNPVGSYYQSGQMQALDAMVNENYDRAAPHGCGDVKAAGNYAADLESMHNAKRSGFPISLYLDAREHRYVEEFNTSNFVAITKDGKYLTPDAPRSVLASNTNTVLRKLAADMGMPVEQRRIDFEAEVESFAEVGAVGTAVVVTPLRSLTRGTRKWQLQEPEVLQKLYEKVRAIQEGESEDRHGWMRGVQLERDQQQQFFSIYPGL